MTIQVAVAAVSDDQRRILITRRPDDVHQGGLWEFPGGKVEAGETVFQALGRELHEELGIRVVSAQPLIRVLHHYPDRSVLLDVHRINEFNGFPHGREGQPWRWVAPDALGRFDFPAADKPIVTALRLPDHYLITGDDAVQAEGFLGNLEQMLAAGVELVQLRGKSLAAAAYLSLADRTLERCHRWGARLLLNGPLDLALSLRADGVHLTSAQLMRLSARPLGRDKLVAASCHNAPELERAIELGLDFAVLSPVRRTASHPAAIPLGWDRFHSLAEQASIPIYALGGMRPADVMRVKQLGGQGIAAIRGLWSPAQLS